MFVSVLFNEPKLLKSSGVACPQRRTACFSALQRAEIAEIHEERRAPPDAHRFSALQRAEIAEIDLVGEAIACVTRFSALQRAEIAEIARRW